MAYGSPDWTHPDEIGAGQGGTLASLIRKGVVLIVCVQTTATTSSPRQGGTTDTERMRSLLTTFRPQAEKYRAVNKLSLNGETNRGPSGPLFFVYDNSLISVLIPQ